MTKVSYTVEIGTQTFTFDSYARAKALQEAKGGKMKTHYTPYTEPETPEAKAMRLHHLEKLREKRGW